MGYYECIEVWLALLVKSYWCAINGVVIWQRIIKRNTSGIIQFVEG